jgi:hypothetical protein
LGLLFLLQTFSATGRSRERVRPKAGPTVGGPDIEPPDRPAQGRAGWMMQREQGRSPRGTAGEDAPGTRVNEQTYLRLERGRIERTRRWGERAREREREPGWWRRRLGGPGCLALFLKGEGDDGPVAHTSAARPGRWRDRVREEGREVRSSQLSA